MTLIETPFLVTPVNGDTPFDLSGHIEVVLTIIPPGISIVMSAPPFTIVLSFDAAAELAAALLELIPVVP